MTITLAPWSLETKLGVLCGTSSFFALLAIILALAGAYWLALLCALVCALDAGFAAFIMARAP